VVCHVPACIYWLCEGTIVLPMSDIFTEIVTALRNHESLALATIISSSGSTPLPSGSSLLVKQSGGTAGTVGGGAVEASVIEKLKKLLTTDRPPFIATFELSEDDVEPGMICGGTIDVLLERLDVGELSLFLEVAQGREEGVDSLLLRGIDAARGAMHRLVVSGETETSLQRDPVANLVKERGISEGTFLQALQRSQREEAVHRVEGRNGEVIIQPIVGTQPLVIFGGGHVGRSLATMAALSGFMVTVVDDREEYAQKARFPEAMHVVSKSWAAAFSELRFKPSSSIVIVTRGHQSDAEVLRHAVDTPARYIGMIGSRKKVVATFAKLLSDGVPESALRRVHAPIGLDIGAVTAEEIAVSIVAELIRARRGFQSPSVPMSGQMSTWFESPRS
jgi:xanthine dehydrogenase accessory factor